MRNLVTSLLEHGQMRTTLAKAKEVRKPLDHMITLGKAGDLSARRQARQFVQSKSAMANLFGDLAQRFAKRQGGYSRILHINNRRGDGAEMALMMLVGDPKDPFTAGAPARKTGKAAKPVLEQVAEEVKAGTGAAAESPAPKGE
jgi:large subunit ribosomal protein L17